MQRVIYILSIATEDVEKLIERLKHDRYDPDALPSIPSPTPSNHVKLSLQITIHEKPSLNMAESIFEDFRAKKLEGPQDAEPDWNQKIIDYLSSVGKEAIAIFLGSFAAVHAAALIILASNNIFSIGNLFSHLGEFILISAIPSGVHLFSARPKYKKIVD